MKPRKTAKPAKPRAKPSRASSRFGGRTTVVSDRVMDQLLESIRNPAGPTEAMKKLMANYYAIMKA